MKPGDSAKQTVGRKAEVAARPNSPMIRPVAQTLPGVQMRQIPNAMKPKVQTRFSGPKATAPKVSQPKRGPSGPKKPGLN